MIWPLKAAYQFSGTSFRTSFLPSPYDQRVHNLPKTNSSNTIIGKILKSGIFMRSRACNLNIIKSAEIYLPMSNTLTKSFRFQFQYEWLLTFA
uniref:Uncharacterized protein n=1 Tax=Rhizophora mucronata TaxID=61149 RepID=A0A2P2IWU9_RHIMU